MGLGFLGGALHLCASCGRFELPVQCLASNVRLSVLCHRADPAAEFAVQVCEIAVVWAVFLGTDPYWQCSDEPFAPNMGGETCSALTKHETLSSGLWSS